MNPIHFDSHMWKTKDKNCGTLSIDLVQVEIPQHPVDLHSIVTVTTKELSSTLQEFRGTILQQRGKGGFTYDFRMRWIRGGGTSIADSI